MKGKIYVLRHALSQHNEWKIRKIFTPSLWLQHDSGIIDAELSSRGKSQALNLQNKFKDLEFDLVICSPLTRTLQTMHFALQGREIPTIVTPLVKERVDRLSDTGKSLKFLMETHPKFKFLHFDDRWKSFQGPDGFEKEDDKSVQLRVKEFKEFIEGMEFESMLLVTHGNFIRYLLDWKLMFPNAFYMAFDKSRIIKDS